MCSDLRSGNPANQRRSAAGKLPFAAAGGQEQTVALAHRQRFTAADKAALAVGDEQAGERIFIANTLGAALHRVSCYLVRGWFME